MRILKTLDDPTDLIAPNSNQPFADSYVTVSEPKLEFVGMKFLRNHDVSSSSPPLYSSVVDEESEEPPSYYSFSVATISGSSVAHERAQSGASNSFNHCLSVLSRRCGILQTISALVCGIKRSDTVTTTDPTLEIYCDSNVMEMQICQNSSSSVPTPRLTTI